MRYFFCFLFWGELCEVSIPPETGVAYVRYHVATDAQGVIAQGEHKIKEGTTVSVEQAFKHVAQGGGWADSARRSLERSGPY